MTKKGINNLYKLNDPKKAHAKCVLFNYQAGHYKDVANKINNIYMEITTPYIY